MGLVPGIVLSVSRRALLAVLAIAISVSYTLVAGAAVSGLNDAQTALSANLGDQDVVLTHPDGRPFDPGSLDETPDWGLARATHEGWTFYTVRIGEPIATNASHAYAGPANDLEAGTTIDVADVTLTVVDAEPPPGAGASWIGVSPTVLDRIGAPPVGQVHVATYTGDDRPSQGAIEAQGLQAREAPAAMAFYTSGSLELVSAVRVTIVASALVVALLTSSFISLELRAKKRSLSTLRLYAGRGYVRRLMAGRGTVLLTAGHLLGAGGTFGLLFLLERADVAALSIDPVFVATAMTATFGGGLLGMVPALRGIGDKLEARDLSERTAPAWLPRPLRLTLTSWRTLVPLLAAGAILAASLGVVFGVVDMPRQLFGSEDATVIAETTNNPLRGSAPAFLGTHMGRTDGFEASSPEIFAPTVVDGKPVILRGIVWENIAQMDGARIVEGEPPDEHGEAVLGTRAARTLDLEVGDAVTVPAAYRRSVHDLTIVGRAQVDGLMADEILTTLGTAREMTDLTPEEVHIVRYRPDPTMAANRTEPIPFPSGIEVTELTIEPANPLAFESAKARVEVVNFGTSPGERQLTLRVNGEPVADAWVEVQGHSQAAASMQFRVPAGDSFHVQVNPSRQVDSGDPAYRIDAPRAVTVDSDVRVTVTTPEDEPVEGVEVELLGQTRTTDADGEAVLSPDRVGNHTIIAEGEAGRASKTIVVVAPEDLHRPHVVVRQVSGPDRIDPGAWSGFVHVENVGGESHRGPVPVPVDGNVTNTTDATLFPGDTRRVGIELDLDRGRHTIGPPEAQLVVQAGEPRPEEPTNGSGTDEGTGDESPASGDGGGDGGSGSDEDGEGAGASGEDDEARTLEELLAQRKSTPQEPDQARADRDPIGAFLADTFENFNAAVTVVAMATVLHAGLVVLVAVYRDVEERGSTLGTVASVGATRKQLRGRALREFAILGIPAAALGVLLGLGLVEVAASLGWIGGFGHALEPRTGLGFVTRLVGVALGVVLVAAVIAVETVRGQSFGRLLTAGPRRKRRPPLSTLIGEEPRG